MRVRTIKMGMSSIAVFLLVLGIAAPAQAQQSQQQPPAEYYQLMGQANYAFKHAGNKADYEEAVKLFQQAVNAAPWLPDTYYDLGKAQQNAEQFNDAISSLQRYLQLKPDANDRDKVNAEIEELQGAAKQEAAQPAIEQQEQQKQAALELVWTDPATGLMWTRKDNGSDVTWQQATDYCQSLTLAGYSDWRLPTIDQLAGIYDPTQNVPTGQDWTAHIKGGIYVTGVLWSSSWDNAGAGGHWFFAFNDANRDSFPLDRSLLHALCVRGS